MTLYSRYVFTAAVGLWMAPLLPAQEPARIGLDSSRVLSPSAGLSVNQLIANSIAEQLRQSGQLRHYTVDVVFKDGTAELNGSVADQTQREEVLRIVQGVPAVERVHDNLSQVKYLTQAQNLEPVTPPTPVAPVPPAADRNRSVPMDPMPIYQAAPSPYDLNPPKMPPYAWPTYAPYNNYSRVAYPTLYPYNAWPFIGPQYPFPKIPLGWRKVSLEWQDGHWWYATHSNSHDWWRLRYW